MGNPHKYAEVIKAWADGKEIEQRNPNMSLLSLPSKPDAWRDFDGVWLNSMEYRIKPEPPKYPQTKMHDQEIRDMLKSPCAHVENFRMMMNAAIARAIEDGQVVFVPNYVDALKFSSDPMVPAAMLEKVAEAVRREFDNHVRSYSYGAANYCVEKVDLSAIIAKVKEGK